MQRGRLELLVIASGVAEPYAKMLRAIIEHNGYQGAVIQSELTREELGHAAGVRRAGCVGLLRGRRHVVVWAGQVDHQGCAVSSLPGSSSSASATPQQPA